MRTEIGQSTAAPARLQWAKAAAALSVVGVAVVLGTHLGGRHVGQVVTDTGAVLASTIASVACLRAGLGVHQRARGSWFLLAAATACWAGAEVTWATYEIVLDQAVPAPSWADLGYLAGVPFAAAALLVHPASPRSGAGRGRSALDALSVATAVSFLAWTFVLGPLWHDSDLSTAGDLVAVSYPFTDIVVIVLVVLTISRADARHRSSLGWVLVGLLAMALADSGYTLLAQSGDYASGDVIDVGWVVGYLAMAIGAYSSALAHEPREAVDAPAAEPALFVTAVAPFVPVLLALGATPLVLHTEAGLDGPARGMCLVLVVLVVARQGLYLYDRRFGPHVPQEAPA